MVAGAQTWNAVPDFSPDQSGQWTYGSSSSLGGIFTQMTAYSASCGGNQNLQCWTIGSFPDAQMVVHNSSGTGQGIDPPDMLNVDPQNGYAVVRWTAPADGIFSVSGLFRSIDRFGTDVYVLGNSSSLFDAVLSGTTGSVATQSVDFSFTQFFASGGTIDFVTHGSDGESFRGTGLSATISEQSLTTAPEPSSLALLGTGIAGIIPMVRRRRR